MGNTQSNDNDDNGSYGSNYNLNPFSSTSPYNSPYASKKREKGTLFGLPSSNRMDSSGSDDEPNGIELRSKDSLVRMKKSHSKHSKRGNEGKDTSVETREYCYEPIRKICEYNAIFRVEHTLHGTGMESFSVEHLVIKYNIGSIVDILDINKVIDIDDLDVRDYVYLPVQEKLNSVIFCNDFEKIKSEQNQQIQDNEELNDHSKVLNGENRKHNSNEQHSVVFENDKIKCTENELILKNHYFPRGIDRKIPWNAIEIIQIVEQDGSLRGEICISGDSLIRFFPNFKKEKQNKVGKGFLIMFKDPEMRLFFTVGEKEDEERFIEIKQKMSV